MTRLHRNTVFLAALTLLAACATWPGGDQLQVNVAGIETLEGQGMEWRMLVKLRVQNPNDAPVEFDGVFLRLDVLDRQFATGVSDERGTVPRFGEVVIGVPVTVSTINIVRQAIGFATAGKPPDRISYRLEGKLNSPGFGSTRFESSGELALPGAAQ